MESKQSRRLLIELYRAGVAAVLPEPVVRKALEQRSSDTFTAMVATGKAAPGMARAAIDMLDNLQSLVVSDHAEPVPSSAHMLLAGHPIPDARSLKAGAAILELCSSLTRDDRLLYLISGGTSALVESLHDEITLSALEATTSLMLNAGATIHELNAVRTTLSKVKGGGVAIAAAPADIVTLAISDVVSDDPSVIGSGPTTRPTNINPAQVVQRYGLANSLPAAVLSAVNQVARPVVSAVHDYVIVASGALAAQAVVNEGRRRGLVGESAEEPLGGSARATSREAIRQFRDTPKLDFLVLWGETTVVVNGSGSGGRCQEAALVAALELDGTGDLAFLAAGTDGIDGPTAAAGGIVDGSTAERGRTLGLNPLSSLKNNDSAPWLHSTKAQLVTGPTGTNVGDLWILLRHEALSGAIA